VRLTAELRELERNRIVKETHANPGRVSLSSADRRGQDYPAVQYRGDYGTFIIRRPVCRQIVRTRDFEVLEGDSDYDETLVACAGPRGRLPASPGPSPRRAR
jgi:hypothetical protein